MHGSLTLVSRPQPPYRTSISSAVFAQLTQTDTPTTLRATSVAVGQFTWIKCVMYYMWCVNQKVRT